MANTTPRRLNRPKQRALIGDAPWHEGDPTRMIAINVPLPEPLMLQLDWMVQNRVIFSKASFIRETVASAATEAIARHQRILDAAAQIEREERRAGERRQSRRRNTDPAAGDRRRADRRTTS